MKFSKKNIFLPKSKIDSYILVFENRTFSFLFFMKKPIFTKLGFELKMKVYCGC